MPPLPGLVERMVDMKFAKIALVLLCAASAAEPAGAAPSQTAVLAGGCFWGVESVYKHVQGVGAVVSGSAGGNRSGLTRSQGEAGDSAEAVRISFDPARVSYDQLLQIFFTVAHDPTQVDRQGPDIGPHYRSAIFPQNGQQRATAEQYLVNLRSSGRFDGRIATRIESGGFEAAGSDQQDYVRKHPREPYVIQNDLPKLEELKRKFPQLWKD